MGKTENKLNLKIRDLKLSNPLILASGCIEYAQELSCDIPYEQFGALITKTITLSKRSGNPMPRTCEVAAGLINSIGIQNEGLEYYINVLLPKYSVIKIPIICSIAGFTIEEYMQLALHLDKEDFVKALEVNISCPNLETVNDKKIIFSQDEHMSYGVIKAIRESTSKPVIAKLSPEVTDISAIAQSVVDAGCDAITVANTYPAMAVDIETRKSKLGSISGGISGPAIKPLTLKKLWDVYNTVDVPIIASGGVVSAEDALEYIITGATFIELGTVNFINPGAFNQIKDGINKYLSLNKIEYEKLIGALKNEKI